MGAGLVTWWMDLPWWLRWIICLGVATVGFFVSIWIFAVGLVLTVVNVFLSWNEILDVLMPRKR